MIYVRPIEQVMRECKGHFFDPSALKFFNSRIHFRAWELDGVYYFITSERLQGYPRGFTVRKQTDGHVESVSEFHEFNTIKKAQQFLREHLSQFDEVPAKMVNG